MIYNVFYKYIYSFVIRKAFFQFGKKSYIFRPLKIKGMKSISIGENTIIQASVWLTADSRRKEYCKLQIGSNVQIGHFNHIYATKEIVIGDNVLTADKVYISDNVHEYSNPNVPIMFQGIRQLQPVHIGDGTWLGENVCVIGASIGKQCVIGSNAVVTKDIPDYSVAVGIPARVIKRYDFENKIWIKTD